jgi:hypothetical protein
MNDGAGDKEILGAVNRGAYPDLPQEVQLLWYKSVAIGL